MAPVPGELLPAVLAAAAQTPGAMAERARRILEQGGYQDALPRDAPPPDVTSFSLGGLELLIRILLWAILAVAVALVIAWLARRFGGRARDAELEPEAARARLDLPLESAQLLAAAGRYAEAIHALLLETLGALSGGAQLPSSFTSREIVARVRLPSRARDALAGLVEAVEISRFGGAPAGARDFGACLDRFHAFRESYHRPDRPTAEGAGP
jgi:hypothetical protein